MASNALTAGDEIPDFEASTLDGVRVHYRRDLWQNKLVVLVAFAAPTSVGSDAYRTELARRQRELTAHDTALLLLDRGEGSAKLPDSLPVPGVVIADRWGGVRFVAHPAADDGLPPLDEVLEWLRFVQVECPECQGEAR